MSDDLYLPIGQRIRLARRRRGLSQHVFGGLVGRSKSWVIKAEQGDIPLDRISVLIRVAEVLRVQLSWLIADIDGYRADEGREVELAGVRTVRGLLAELRFRTTPAAEPRALADLEADLWAVESLRGQVRHADSLAILPALLTGLHDAALGLAGEERQRAWSLLVRGYEVTARTLGRYDVRPLSHLAAERAMHAAEQSGRPDDLVFGANSVALALQGLGYLEESLRVAEHGLERAAPDRGDPRVRSMVGHLHATSLAITSARGGDDRRATDSLEQAAAIMQETPVPDDIREWTQFRPANLHIQRVSMAVDAGDPREALRVSERHGSQIHAEMASTSRRSRHLLDVATASSHLRDTGRMMGALLNIEAMAPAQLRNYALVPEMLRGALRRERGPRNAELHALARRLKVA